MTAHRAGRPLAVALSLCTAAGGSADTLSIETDVPLARIEVADGDGWCLRWNHSVTGGAVADCFVNNSGVMVLHRSYLHDFAAGLGEVPGRGHLRSAEGGGYWIEDIDEAIPGNALPLRVGRPRVDHRLISGDTEIGLSDIAAGLRVTLRLIP